MKALSKVSLLALAVFLIPVTVFALPALQLDIAGGEYDPVTETIVTTADVFDLSALLTPKNGTDWTIPYYISIAVMPQTGPDAIDLGSFTIDGQEIAVTGDMVYGTPPLEEILSNEIFDAGDLPTHGIFDTFYLEVPFYFDGTQVAAYNVDPNAAEEDQPAPGTMSYINTWTIDTTGLDEGVNLHFDFYSQKIFTATDVDLANGNDIFAPFSHDAETRVPEPGTLILLGTGLLGLGLVRRSRKAL